MMIQNKIKRIAIIAPTGMLGSGVYTVLKDNYYLILVYRDEKKIRLLEKIYGKNDGDKICFDIKKIYNDISKFEKLTKQIGPVDAVINCAGIINKYANKNIVDTFFINSVFPQMLSQKYKEKLIHITTDCVFDGVSNFPYTEKSTLSAMNAYGISK
jgi:dTDP-4-dehydrorhamnose reductase